MRGRDVAMSLSFWGMELSRLDRWSQPSRDPEVLKKKIDYGFVVLRIE
jgi:hypothetical protein